MNPPPTLLEGTPKNTWVGCAASFQKPLSYLWPQSCDASFMYPIYNLSKTLKPYLWYDQKFDILFMTLHLP